MLTGRAEEPVQHMTLIRLIILKRTYNRVWEGGCSLLRNGTWQGFFVEKREQVDSKVTQDLAQYYLQWLNR